MADIAVALVRAAAQLARVSDTPRLDAELLMAHALGMERDALLLHAMRQRPPDGFGALVERRRRHEPVAYIVGWADFWTIRLHVGPGALIPRADSETLIEAAIDICGAGGPATILDLGTGPGTLLLAALDQWRDATGVGVDKSPTALELARANAGRLGMGQRAAFALGDWAGPERAALVLANPPYIAHGAIIDRQVADHEPASALFAGHDGLDDYRRLFPALDNRLLSGGVAIVEIGHDQRVAATRLAVDAGFAVHCRRDLGGRDRALICRRRDDLA